jgi:hypothetical protein
MMNTIHPQMKISRRDFLKFSSIAGVTVVGGYLLSEYTPGWTMKARLS